jgi:hypothetical protein
MADKKISALTGATTPLAGTEVLPIVQSGTTVKVAVSDLTAGRGVTMATASVGTTISQKALTVATDQMFYTTAGDGVANTVLGKISAQVRNYGGASAYSFADVVWATDPTTWYLGELRFATNGFDGTGSSPTTRMTIGSAGNVTVNTGNVVIGTSGKGIDFSATPGTGTSELLADYEEGEFTPTVEGTTSAGSATYAYQIGRYTKTGNRVSFTLRVGWSGGTGTGNLLVAGLPFASANVTVGGYSSVHVFAAAPSNVALTAGNVMFPVLGPNTTKFNVEQQPSDTAVAYDAAGAIIITGTYEV